VEDFFKKIVEDILDSLPKFCITLNTGRSLFFVHKIIFRCYNGIEHFGDFNRILFWRFLSLLKSLSSCKVKKWLVRYVGPKLTKWPFQAFFFYFRLLNTIDSRWLDSNGRSLISVVTTLPTDPQPLPLLHCWPNVCNRNKSCHLSHLTGEHQVYAALWRHATSLSSRAENLINLDPT